MNPTPEQQTIVNAKTLNTINNTKGIIKVNASAGSGKTSSICLVANTCTTPSLYLAFNKALAVEATGKLPTNVLAKTTHSLAYGKFGNSLKTKLTRPKGKYVNVAGTPSEIAKYYKIKPIDDMQANAIGLLVKKTVARFQSSADSELTIYHVPSSDLNTYKESHKDFNIGTAKAQIVKYAKSLWDDRTNTNSVVLADHDTYLKLFQLSKPDLSRYGIIYLDEGQDSTDVVLDIVLSQTSSQVVVVGDNRQNIYSWKGAVNALEKIQGDTHCLTKSFRYGQVIADIATAIIGGEINIVGNECINSKVGYVNASKQYAHLFRTNSALLMEAVALVECGLKVCIEIDTKDFLKLLESAISLYNDNYKAVKHDKIIPYGTWEDLVEATEHDFELGRLVRIVTGDVKKFQWAINKTTSSPVGADVILTTAHKSKGREFDQVRLASDFKVYEDIADMPVAEANLLYVAATRAVNLLETNEMVDKIIRTYYDETAANKLLKEYLK